MKRLLLSVAVTMGFAGSSFAADLAVKSRPMAAAPVAYSASWTGCYVGAGGGYGMFVQRHRSLDPLGVPFTTGEVDTGGKGWFGTVQVGCDYQFADRWVFGVFGDYDWSGLKGNLAPSVGGVFVGEEKLRDSWAVGGRLGYAVFPQLLTYVSGGYTQARFNGVTFVSALDGSATGLTLDAQTYKGWFLGTGYEYGLSFIPGLFWKTEYRYASYREESPGIHLTAPIVGTTLVGFERGHKDVQTIRSELVYRFNFGGGPVVARY
jgi:outer membrane immunogenic protein